MPYSHQKYRSIDKFLGHGTIINVNLTLSYRKLLVTLCRKLKKKL